MMIKRPGGIDSDRCSWFGGMKFITLFLVLIVLKVDKIQRSRIYFLNIQQVKISIRLHKANR